MSTWSNGSHPYRGSSNDRSKRGMPKLYKGIKKINLSGVFEQIEKEKRDMVQEKVSCSG